MWRLGRRMQHILYRARFVVYKYRMILPSRYIWTISPLMDRFIEVGAQENRSLYGTSSIFNLVV